MRTVGEIIGAVQEQQPATEEELRLALLCLNYTLTMVAKSDYESVSPTLLKWRAKENFELLFRVMRADPSGYLGPNWTPGTPENTDQRATSKAFLKAFEKAKP